MSFFGTEKRRRYYEFRAKQISHRLIKRFAKVGLCVVLALLLLFRHWHGQPHLRSRNVIDIDVADSIETDIADPVFDDVANQARRSVPQRPLYEKPRAASGYQNSTPFDLKAAHFDEATDTLLSILFLVEKETESLSRWLKANKAYLVNHGIEWLFGLRDNTPESLRSAITELQSQYGNLRVVYFGDDIDPVDVLNTLITRYARSEIISSMNMSNAIDVDHMVNAARFLSRQHDVSGLAVSNPWIESLTTHSESAGLTINKDNLLKVSDMFLYDTYGRILQLEQSPYEVMLWNRSVHTLIGLFDSEKKELSSLDFWVRALQAGVQVQALQDPKIGLSEDIHEPARRDQETARAIFKSIASRHQAAIGCRTLNILVAFERTLHLDEGADRRIVQLLKWLRTQGHQVHFSWRRTKGVKTGSKNFDSYDKVVEDIRPTTKLLDQWGISYTSADFNLTQTMDSIIAGAKFDIAIAPEWFWWGHETGPELLIPGLREHSPDTKIVVLTDDIHHERLGQTKNRCNAQCVARIKQREIKAYTSADLVLTVTDQDAEQVRKLGAQLVESLPHTEDPAELEYIGFESRKGALFVGSGHGGNQRAVKYLVNEIVPLVRAKDPAFELHLVGSKIWNEFKMPGVISHGHVSDPLPYLSKAKVFVNPNMILGSGIATKNVLAMNHGLPLITSPAGRAGLCLEDEPCDVIRVATRVHEFSDIILELISNETLWKKAHLATLRHARAAFSLQRLSNMNSIFGGMMRSLSRIGCKLSTDVRATGATKDHWTRSLAS